MNAKNDANRFGSPQKNSYGGFGDDRMNNKYTVDSD